ncbi:zinc uptake protein ZrgA [Photobacterium galatheae]|uniref:Zinc-binding protein n=1 Tax=Photobacterium galatheae TaxID=1654360 RepID=A0A066RQ02_9GAMM|nr:DUF2796 domain-containing protein [Photobacterium galatheae]KDM92545.1 hypothetical protein EA58_06270 [Photobacterium galatheae]MCM0148022.1 DUF2796 domain-containing protein [Photobacterium galatheae]
MPTQQFRAATWLLFSAATCTAPAWAYTQHEAHVHGQVELNMAQDGNDLLLEITAPAADVIGFEHPPETDAEKQTLTQAVQQLNHPETLLSLNASAGCQLHERQVSHTLSEHAESHDHDEHEHHDHDHEKHSEHDHDDHEEHGHHDHEAHKDHDHHGEHGEFSVQYTYHCDTIDQLNALTLKWFSHFPATEKVQLQAITAKGQQAATLTANQPEFRF